MQHQARGAGHMKDDLRPRPQPPTCTKLLTPRSSTTGPGSMLVPALLIRMCSGVLVSDSIAVAKPTMEAGLATSSGGTAGGYTRSAVGTLR